jgi:hypothetical protein
MNKIRRSQAVFKALLALLSFSLLIAIGSATQLTLAESLIPQIDGEWWPVASNPDLGQYTSDRQQPVDFAIWQARDGTWQIWSCIRPHEMRR